jgi:hypothetical protein
MLWEKSKSSIRNFPNGRRNPASRILRGYLSCVVRDIPLDDSEGVIGFERLQLTTVHRWMRASHFSER